jgi:hypothetical protein
MEKDVLSKHRKALMLIGISYLYHGGGVGAGNAVTIYEKDYPGRTFIVQDLGNFDLAAPVQHGAPFADWPYPSLVETRGTWLGALGISPQF